VCVVCVCVFVVCVFMCVYGVCVMCLCVCVWCVCVLCVHTHACIVFGWENASKNIFYIEIKVIQTFSDVNKYTSCRHTFKLSNTQHTDSSFFIYTERVEMYKFIIKTVGFTCKILQYSPLNLGCGKYGN